MAEKATPAQAGREYLLDTVEDAVTVEHHDALTGFVAFQVSDFGATLTLTFEATLNDRHSQTADWVVVGAVDTSDMSTVATTATANGIYRIDASGLQKVRCRASTVSGGGSANVIPNWHVG